MITVHIQGLQDGQVPIDITVPASSINAHAPEFVNDIRVHGTMTKVGRRYAVAAHVDATARLICDRSLEPFDEPIAVRIDLDFEVDTQRAMGRTSDDPWDDDDIIPIREDDKEIDLTDQVRQELVVHLPMRRVAPKYRDKDIEDIYPELADRTSDDDVAPPDDTWAALRNLKQQ